MSTISALTPASPAFPSGDWAQLLSPMGLLFRMPVVSPIATHSDPLTGLTSTLTDLDNEPFPDFDPTGFEAWLAMHPLTSSSAAPLALTKMHAKAFGTSIEKTDSVAGSPEKSENEMSAPLPSALVAELEIGATCPVLRGNEGSDAGKAGLKAPPGLENVEPGTYPPEYHAQVSGVAI